MMYSLNEVGLIPAESSNIKHRSLVNPYDKNGFLPIFVSPMTCISGLEDIDTYLNSKVIQIIPRPESIIKDDNGNIHLLDGNMWKALSLQDFIELFLVRKDEMINQIKDYPIKILIDIANGHMDSLFDSAKEAKKIYGDNLILMVGNIANYYVYEKCILSDIDYVRVSIGTGSACTTSMLTGIHASHVYLLEGINEIRDMYKYPYSNLYKSKLPKVIIDGGINTIDKAIKALALGADYVMMGKMFAQCNDIHLSTLSNNNSIRDYYGMASNKGQLDLNGSITKSSEGAELKISTKYSIKDFLNKFEAALRSCMSYCNADCLDNFIGKVKYEIMSQEEFNSYYDDKKLII